MYDRHRFTTVDSELKFHWKRFCLCPWENATRAGTTPQRGDLLEPFLLGAQQTQPEDLEFSPRSALNLGSRVSLAGKIFYNYDRGQVAEGGRQCGMPVLAAAGVSRLRMFTLKE
jgi:hypothetical protein